MESMSFFYPKSHSNYELYYVYEDISALMLTSEGKTNAVLTFIFIIVLDYICDGLTES